MSGATHTQIPIRQRLRRDQRRARTIALAAVTAFTAMLVALLLALDGGDPPTTDDNRPAVQAKEPSTPQSREPGVRFDGGPEEGTRGVLSAEAGPSTRYDGGPEEGSRGIGR